MPRTLTCPCGKTLLADEHHPREPAICPACGAVVTDAATAVQTTAPLAPSTAGTAEAPLPRPTSVGSGVQIRSSRAAQRGP